jgi:hypothetical protein
MLPSANCVLCKRSRELFQDTGTGKDRFKSSETENSEAVTAVSCSSQRLKNGTILEAKDSAETL